eukprot:m.225226 g.225226  ORF g.225226 m.225226 type:complete len:356 (-) comp16647_c0_seq1:76-1143(-)
MAEAAKRRRVESDKTAFVNLFPSLLEELVGDIKTNYPDFDQGAIKWFQESFEYNCLGGKMNRGLSVLDTFRHLKAPAEPTAEEIEDAQVLGWCIEWLQAFFLVSDDMMDGSITRRGQPCWYRKEGVGNIAINDSFMIEAAIYKILSRRFRSRSYYVDILELFHETTHQTELGQMLDLITAPEDKVDLTKFSIEKYKCIVKYKTAFYSFYLPVALAMMLGGVKDAKAFDDAKVILLEMGEFFQIQDDYLDCYGAPEVIGKIGTDIEDNKCGWLVVQALARVTPAQRVILENNYGKKDPAAVKTVKHLYAELGLEKIFKDYEEESYKKLTGLIETHAGSLPHAIFLDFAAKIYKRTK